MKINHVKTHTITLICVSFWMLLGVACKEQEKPVQAVAPGFTNEIHTESVKEEPVHETLRLNGFVQYNPSAVVHFISLIDGVITTTYADVGEAVKKGQVLADIKSTELSSLSAEQRRLKSQLTVAQRSLSETESFFKDGIASQKEVVQATSEVESLQADLSKIQADLQLYSASSEKGVFQIKAPMDGLLVESIMAPGMQVNDDNDELFTVANLDEVWIYANVYAADIADVKKNMEVSIKSSSYKDKTFEGIVDNVSQVFDSEEKVLKARIKLKNGEMLLKPGLSVEVLVQRKSSKVLPKISESALIFNNNKNYVLIENTQGLQVQEVTIATRDEHTIYIQNGLQSGDMIVTENVLLLYQQLQESI